MAKKDKVVNVIPDGMKCFQKSGGGSIRFPNRIIKTGQKFWIDPNAIPKQFLYVVKEVAPDNKAVVVVMENVPVAFTTDEAKEVADKFEMVKATDETGEVITKGTSQLYNVIDEAGKLINDKPLRKGKAEELLETLNV